MAAPRLTDRVLRGLQSLTVSAMAGDMEEVTGTMDRKVWADVDRACEWVSLMISHRENRAAIAKATGGES